jgi:hypothetical protein
MTITNQQTSFNYQVTGSDANVQTFTASGQWIKPPNIKLVRVCVWGGGGGGASGGRGTSSAAGGAGGGGGARVSNYFQAACLPSQVQVTIGAGGAGGAAVSSSVGGLTGTAGGTSSFGSYVTAYGGGGGGIVGTSSNNRGAGGGGGGSGGTGQTPTGTASLGGLPSNATYYGGSVVFCTGAYSGARQNNIAGGGGGTAGNVYTCSGCPCSPLTIYVLLAMVVVLLFLALAVVVMGVITMVPSLELVVLVVRQIVM